MPKRNKKKNYLLPFFIVAVIILGSSLIMLSLNGHATKNEPICKDVEIPYDYNEEYLETVPYTDTECESKLLVYNRGDFDLVSSVCNQKIEECQSYFLGICTNKITYCTDRTITCSLGINNLDDEKGVWKVDFNFFKYGSDEIEATASQSRMLDPYSSGDAIGQGEITSKELYNSSYSCSYVISKEPTKQVCRDVTKYKEVTKTRVVTRYKNETICN